MKYNSVNSWDAISLHDCDISSISINNNIVCCKFDDGFWVTPNHPLSQSDKTVRTDETSQINIYGLEQVQILWAEAYREEETNFQKKYSESDLRKLLIQNINEHHWRVEIITETLKNARMNIRAVLSSNSSPYFSDVLISFKFGKMEYLWNHFHFDSVF